MPTTFVKGDRVCLTQLGIDRLCHPHPMKKLNANSCGTVIGFARDGLPKILVDNYEQAGSYSPNYWKKVDDVIQA